MNSKNSTFFKAIFLGMIGAFFFAFNFVLIRSMNLSELKHQAKVEEWKQRIMDCRSSGLTGKQWCAAYGGNPSTYYRWERELFKKNAVSVENSIQAIDNHPKALPVLAELAVATPQQGYSAKMIHSSLLPLSVSGR